MLSEDRRREIADRVTARFARCDVPAEVEQLPDGGWTARKLGCTGLGTTPVLALLDLDHKVELVYGTVLPERVRDKLDETREADRETVRRLLQG